MKNHRVSPYLILIILSFSLSLSLFACANSHNEQHSESSSDPFSSEAPASSSSETEQSETPPAEPDSIQAPKFSIDKYGNILIDTSSLNFDVNAHIMIDDGEIITVPSGEAYRCLKSCRVKVRLSNTKETVFSEWSEELTYTKNSLAAPTVTVDALGKLTVSPVEGAVSYVAVSKSTGESYPLNDKNSILTPYAPIYVYACADPNSEFIDSDYSDEMIFAPEYITFSATENTLEALTDNGDGTYSITAISSLGKEYSFMIEGQLEFTKEGWAAVSPQTKIYNIDAIHGILASDIAYLSDAVADKFSYGFELDGNDRINTYAQLDIRNVCAEAVLGYMRYEALPSYLSFENGEEAVVVEKFTLYFDNTETLYSHCTVNDLLCDVIYIPGSPFIPSLEKYALNLYFNHGEAHPVCVNYDGDMKLGELVDKNGTVITTNEAYHMRSGDGIEVTFGSDFKTVIPLVKETFGNAHNSNEIRPNSFSSTVGEMNVLVVPIYWKDQSDRATDKNLEAIYRSFGNIIDESGKVTVYAPNNGTALSLSECYRIASFDKLTVNAFVTDWYAFDANYTAMRDRKWNAEQVDAVYQWVLGQYPELDMSRFDSDRDGVLDEIVFVNTGDMKGYTNYTADSFGGAYRNISAISGMESTAVGTPNSPTVLHFVNINLGFLFSSKEIGELDGLRTSVLIHEFGHSLGLWDYYDVSHGNISPLGGYDMQDGNVGDWNVYSKYTAGWITPTVIDDTIFENTDSIEITVRSSALTGDAVIIPAFGYDYNGTPFDEYIILDLFTPDGLHKKDSALYSLHKSVGVRIYHVSDLHEKRISGDLEFGYRHYSNDSKSFWSKIFGFYQIEIISATGKNHFTSYEGHNNLFSSKDLFIEGDSFDAESLDEFFHNGKMDNGMSFGYTIAVTSIDYVNGEYVATLVISKAT